MSHGKRSEVQRVCVEKDTTHNKTRPHNTEQETRRQEAMEDKATQDHTRRCKTQQHNIKKELFLHQTMNPAYFSSNQAPF
jgi:hypothetical protein